VSGHRFLDPPVSWVNHPEGCCPEDVLDLSLKGYQDISRIVVMFELEDFAVQHSKDHHPIVLVVFAGGPHGAPILTLDNYPVPLGSELQSLLQRVP
jgi:hypothetical protein